MARLEGTRLILAVQDLRAATDVYVNALGFRRDFGDESDGWSWLSRDNFRVGLGECPDAVPAKELGDHPRQNRRLISSTIGDPDIALEPTARN